MWTLVEPLLGQATDKMLAPVNNRSTRVLTAKIPNPAIITIIHNYKLGNQNISNHSF
jgi:hypothetical protein